MEHTQSKHAGNGCCTVMYRATKFTIYRDRTRIINETSEDAFYVSKEKAVDHLRRFSEQIEDAVGEYKRYADGKRVGWKDVFVSLWVYEECEGRLVRRKAIPYKEVMDGQYLDRSGDLRFETF